MNDRINNLSPNYSEHESCLVEGCGLLFSAAYSCLRDLDVMWRAVCHGTGWYNR